MISSCLHFKSFVAISAVHKAKRVYLSVNNVSSVRNAYVEQVERLLLPVEVPGDVNFALGAVYGKFIAGITVCERKKTEQLSAGVIERVRGSFTFNFVPQHVTVRIESGNEGHGVSDGIRLHHIGLVTVVCAQLGRIGRLLGCSNHRN